MDSGTAFLLMLLVIVVLLFVLFLTIVAMRSAYHNGIRDGYQNTWLPHVQKQVKEEGLRQGDEVRRAEEYK
jgi:ABC-type phosphate transport system permease subunit